MLTSSPLPIHCRSCRLWFGPQGEFIFSLLESSSTVTPKSFVIDLDMMLVVDPPSPRMRLTF